MDIRSQFVLPMWTGQPRDVITNTMHWEGDGLAPLDVQAAEIASRLQLFYNTIYGTLDMMGGYLEPSLATVECYDLADPTPRIPEVVACPITADTLSSSILPSEVAIVMTIHAAPQSGVPRQRLHNRIYLGGLGNGAVAAVPPATPQVSIGARTNIANAAEALVAANTSVLSWVQRSFVGGVTNRPIAGGWVDNEPDTQRRRGTTPESRTLWTA